MCVYALRAMIYAIEIKTATTTIEEKELVQSRERGRKGKKPI